MVGKGLKSIPDGEKLPGARVNILTKTDRDQIIDAFAAAEKVTGATVAVLDIHKRAMDMPLGDLGKAVKTAEANVKACNESLKRVGDARAEEFRKLEACFPELAKLAGTPEYEEKTNEILRSYRKSYYSILDVIRANGKGEVKVLATYWMNHAEFCDMELGIHKNNLTEAQREHGILSSVLEQRRRDEAVA